MRNPSDLGLLFLHALPFDAAMWSGQMSILPDRTYAPDLYAHGPDITRWAESSLATTPSDQLIVVGCSVGGSCALEVAQMAPDRIKALVLIGTKARHDPNPEQLRRAIEIIETKGVEGAWEACWAPLFGGVVDESITARAKEIALGQSKEALINGLSAFHSRPSREELVANSNIPIHVVTGAHDPLPGLAYSQRLAATAKNGHLHVVRDCGHYVPMAQPIVFNELLKRVIETYGGDEHV